MTAARKKTQEISYKNPWYTPHGIAPETYQRFVCTVTASKCGRGSIVKVGEKHFDYLVNGRVITQRCGKNMSLLDNFIAAICDGIEFDDYWIERAKACYESQE